MKSRLKRIVSGAAACAVVAGTASVLLSASVAYAATNGGAADIVNPANGAPLSSGSSNTSFRFRLPTGAACAGDSPNGGYRIQSYLVPQSVDVNTLQFDSSGPVPVAGQFRAPMFDAAGDPYVDQLTAAAVPAGGPGPIIQPLPSFNFAVYTPGGLTPGVYNVGIACTLGPPSATQLDRYFNTVMTLTANPAEPGPAKVSWAFGAAPVAPNLTTVTPGNGTLTASYTSTASTPATTLYTVTATPASGPSVTGTSASPSSTTVSGLTNGTAYSVSVKAANSAGSSPSSNAVSATPAQANHPAVQNLTATPGTGKVTLAWTAPADAGTDPPTGYTVVNAPAGGTTTVSGTTAEVTGLAAGTVYTFTVTATYATAPGGTPAMVQATPLASQVLTQTITVTRPVGALVLTQVCGRNGALAADTTATPGFPAGSLPAVAATAPGAGTAPQLGAGLDPKFSEYPYPENADGTPAPSYPTSCGIALGNAKLVKSGPGGGQFFAASGVLNQVTVVDTRDTDIGWGANGTMGPFTAGAGKTFSGSQLGWTPVRTSDTGAFTDSDGVSYDQVAQPGAVVQPNSPNSSGMSSGRSLGMAAALAGTSPTLTGGLGIAELDARLKLLIPVTAKSGSYTGVLTISAV